MTQPESLKRETIIHCEVLSTQHNLVMCSDAQRFIQLTADKVYTAEATQEEVRAGYEGVAQGGNHLVLVVGGRGSGKAVSVFGRVEEEGGDVAELGIVAGVLEKALERDFEYIRFSAILLRSDVFQDLLSSETGESLIKHNVGSIAEARFLIGQTHAARQKALEADSEPDHTHTFLLIETKDSAQANKIVICITEAQTCETQVAIQRCFSRQIGSKPQNRLTDYLKSELAGDAKVHILGSVSPVIDQAPASLTTLHFLSSLKTAKPIKPQLPLRSSKRSARTSSLGSSPLSEASLLQLVMLGDADISEAMETLRRMELSTAAEELSKSLPAQGRCPVCTLRIPCEHFREAGEAMRSAAPSQMSSLDSRLRTPRHGRSSSTQRPPRDSKEKAFRYRDKSGAYVQTKSTPESQPLPQSKLALMEKLEAYREEKLRKELQRLEALKLQQKAETEAAVHRETQRRKYYEQQKLKLAEYHAKRKQHVSRSLHVSLRPQRPKLPSSDRISLYDYKRDFIFHMVARQEKDWGLLRHSLAPAQRRQKDAVDLL